MAGNRRSEFVSIPMGPGVLSNTTPRGAKSRNNSVMWDRWKDSTWVRWHKLLAEKLGGWQFQALSAPNSTPALITGSPVLLLHMDGTQGSQTFTDSSSYANVMTALNGAQVSTADPKFGTGAYQIPSIGTSAFNAVNVPIVANGPLDLFTNAGWTIEGQFVITAATGGQLYILDWGGANSSGSGVGSQIYVTAIPGSPGYLHVTDYSAYGTGQTAGGNAAIALGTYYHFAIVKSGATITVYLNGTALSSLITTTGHAYTANPLSVTIGNASPASDTNMAGYVDEVRATPIALYTTNFTPPTAANTLGTPNALGMVIPPNGLAPTVYLGLARGLKDWSSIDGQFWIAIGTHLKLYVVNNLTLYDITPDRKSSNLTNAASTTSGSAVVTIVDTDHRAATGDFIDISSATTVGGVGINGDWQITVVDPNTYTITVAGNATSTATGGGNFTVTYEIGAGLPSNGELLGYGTYVYGASTYGTPRPAGTGVFARLRSWSLDNYGQDLIASQSDGEIYWWQRNSGPNTVAGLIVNAPQGVQRCLVDAAQRVIIALGCTDVTSAFDSMLVRWCSLDDITDWYPTDVNTAGDFQLTAGSRIVTGIKTKGQNLIWTDTQLYRMVYVGGTDIYDFIPAGIMAIVGPNAALDVNGVAYVMGFDNFYTYSGTLQILESEVWETVFDANLPTSLLKSQTEKVFVYTYEPRTEITWLYPSVGGSGECDRYVTYNWEDDIWYYGAWMRTAAQGRAPAMGGYPYGVNGGYLYQHEIGTDGVEFTGTTALAFYMESLDITTGGAKSEYTLGGSDARFAIGGSDSHLRVTSLVPDWKYFSGQMNVYLKTKDRPQDPTYVIDGPVAFDSTTIQVDLDAHGSQLALRFDNLTATGGAASVGTSFRMGVWQAEATPYAKR